MPSLALQDRVVLRASGPDAGRLLQDVLTPDLDQLQAGEALPGALLTPQGKIMFDFLISRSDPDGFLIEVARDVAGDFAKRMMLYKLRAKMEIDGETGLSVGAVWDETPPDGAILDRRFREEPKVYRVYETEAPASTAAPDDYRRLRIAAGVAEGGVDYAFSDVFPHDVLLDLNGGVSFRKGCFVGQEVVSRMQHRGTARRRVAIVTAPESLPQDGASITADAKPAGALGSTVNGEALAIVRTDRIAAALESGGDIRVGSVPVQLRLPPWTGLTFEKAAGDAGD